MLNIILVKNYEEAKKIAKELKSEDKEVCAIECEYGENALEEPDVDLALNHHGKYSDNLPPSQRYDLYDKLEKPFDNFIISHIDLDTIFGILWASKILRPTEIAKTLADLSAIQDLNGFHYMERYILDSLETAVKFRFLAIGHLVSKITIEDNDSIIVDISRIIHKAILKIKDIIVQGVPNYYKDKINDWLINKEKEAIKYLVDETDFYNFYIASNGINLLSAYKVNNKFKEINIVYNSESRVLSLACFSEEEAIKYFGEKGVITPLQNFFGSKSGGRISVGGSPRDEKITKEQALAFKEFLDKEYFNDINSPKKLINYNFI